MLLKSERGESVPLSPLFLAPFRALGMHILLQGHYLGAMTELIA